MILRSLKFIFLLLVFFPLYSCSVDREYEEVSSPTEIYTAEGVSLLPPEGEGWLFEKNHAGSIQFFKGGERKDQSIGAFINLNKLPAIKTEKEFLALVSEQRIRNTSDPRYETIQNIEELSNERDDYCVRFHTIYKDFKAHNLPADANYLIVEDIGTICRHPYNKNIGVTIALSQRTLTNNRFENFESLANDYIKNVTFIPFSKTNREIGLDYLNNNEFELAVKHFNIAIAENPKDEKNYDSRGSAYEKLSNYTIALKDFNKALELNPDYANAYYNRGVVYSRLSKENLALQDFSKAINLNTKDAWAYYNRATIYQNQSKYSQALQDLGKAIELKSDLRMAYNNIAWIYATCADMSFRNGDKAVAFALKAINLREDVAGLDTLAAAYVEAKEYKKAFETYKKVIQNDKSYVNYYQKSLKEKGCYIGPINGVYNHKFEEAMETCISEGKYL